MILHKDWANERMIYWEYKFVSRDDLRPPGCESLTCVKGGGEGACGAFYFGFCRDRIKNQPYKRRRVGRNLRLSRADPALCSGQPSPLRCILLSPQGLTTLRGPRLYGVYRRVGVSGSSPSDFWLLFFIEKYPPPGRRTNEYLL